MKHIFVKFAFVISALFVFYSAQAQTPGNRPINLNDPNELSYLNQKNFVIGGVEVKGVEYLDKDVLITISKLTVGQYIEVPSEQTANVIKDLMAQNLFEEVQLYATSIQGENIFLEIRVVERPRLAGITVEGLKKSQAEEVRKRLNAGSGKIVNENLLRTTRSTIEKYLREKSYLYPDITITTAPDSVQANYETVTAQVERNSKIKVRKVNFTGAENFSDRQLRKFLKGVKPRAWFRIFGPGRFKEDKYEEAKENLIAKMQDKGYRDAEILRDSIWRYGKKEIAIDLDLYEGPRYYVGNITWTGNSKYQDSILSLILGINKGDIYSEEKIHARLMGPTRASDDIAALYQNDGYLTFSIEPIIKRIEKDTIDLEIQMFEGKQYTINNVILKGNDVTNDRVVLRSIFLKPGMKYSREALVSSIREISQLGMFDEQKITPNPAKNLNMEEGTTDLEFTVVEKASDQVELSGGYGAGQVIGTLGLNFNNFSTSNFFKKDSWKPLPRGDGQKLSIRGQTSGRRYQSYNASFSEPWLGGKKPIYFGLNAYVSNMREMFFQGSQWVERENAPFINMHGITATLGKRLQWPDRYFQVNSSLSFQRYVLNNYAGLFLFADGDSYNINFTQEISRNTVDAPIYPTSGSNIRLSVQLTPPYSLWNNVDYATAPANEVYKFVEYHKWKFDSQWYTTIAGKLVLKSQAQFGYLGMYGGDAPISPFERFVLGGDGMQGFDFLQGTEIIAMRGYANGTVIPESTGGGNAQNIAVRSGSPIYARYQLELRHPIMLNEQATVFALAFAEAGNTWNTFREFNPFKVRRTVGVGARIFLPIFGMLGIDYGHAFDPIPGMQESRWRQNFTFSIIQNMGGF